MSYQSAKDWQDSQPGTQTTQFIEELSRCASKIAELEAQVAELKAQRDALLEACQFVELKLGYLVDNGLGNQESIEMVEEVRRAIAQATGR